MGMRTVRGAGPAAAFPETFQEGPRMGGDWQFENEDEVFGQVAKALADGDIEERLRGPVAHSGFRRLTG